MAIYSLHHSSIGKSTQKTPYTTSAHVSYITRKSALSRLEASRVPAERAGAMMHFHKVEDQLRKNGRVADKVLLALPRELSSDARAELVRNFAEEITDGRASWLAAFHEKGKDEANPHCHLLIADRDISTGKRVFGMSDKGSTERIRKLWEVHANAALAKAGAKQTIDRRTLEAQGITRKPTIHVGVRSRQILLARRRITSQVRRQRNSCLARSEERTVTYPAIDQGGTRMAWNVAIRRQNLIASRAENREEDYWKAIDEDAFLRDVRELKRINAVLRYSDDGRDLVRSRDETFAKGPEF